MGRDRDVVGERSVRKGRREEENILSFAWERMLRG